MTKRQTENAVRRSKDADSSLSALPRSLAIELLRAREAVMSHFRPILAAHDVSEQQWRVIRALSEQGTLDATDVAEKAFILAPSLTRMIRSLEERGFIVKEKDEADGRRVLLSLAPAGRDVIDAVTPHSIRAYAEIDTRFGKTRRNQLLQLLADLAELRADPQSADPQSKNRPTEP
jgi:homoprotocatechuate degradation regulator HpaR